MNDIRNIPGVGEKTAQRLVEHFGSEEAVMDMFHRHDISSIAAVSGIGEKNAVALVQGFIYKDENISPDDFLKTAETKRIYRRLLDIIKSYTGTIYARDKLNIYFPMVSSRREKIDSIITQVSAACRMVNDIGSDEKGIDHIRKTLKGIRPLRKEIHKKIRERVVVAADHEEYKHTISRFGNEISVVLAESPREFVDAAASYLHVIASMGLEGIDLPHEIKIEYANLARLEPWQVIPEKEIGFFSYNLDTIISAIKTYRIFRQSGTHLFSDIDEEKVDRLEKVLDLVGPEGDVRSGADRETDAVQKALDGLDDAVKTAERFADDQFKEFLNSSIVTLSGKDLLDAVGGGVKDILDKNIAGKYQEIIRQSTAGIIKGLDLGRQEALLAEELFSQEIMTSIQADQDAVERLRQSLNTRSVHRRMEILKDTARSLTELKDTARALASKAMELDMWFAIGLFARDRDLVTPQLHDGPGIEIKGGKNLFFSGSIEPVDYAIGPQINVAEGYSPERVVVLSGVNSGGKTSILDLLAQILILSHMGFPVPAKAASIGLVDEFYYFGKSGGTMDAGAFESTIRDFSVVSGTGKMLLLVDELESITEPGASARIIGGILESLSENPHSMGVFVSHLAESIMEHTSGAVRVDGIEARGLDEQLNLIVDRNPRYNYVAKSTPELIVERLARKSKGIEKGFYERLLKKFK